MSENKVKWHPYPQEKPKNDSRNPYLVTWLYDGVCGKEPEVDLFYYEDDAFKWNLDNEVIAIGAEDEFGVALGDVSSKMKQMGIDILNQQGNMRDMGNIIEELMSLDVS